MRVYAVFMIAAAMLLTTSATAGVSSIKTVEDDLAAVHEEIEQAKAKAAKYKGGLIKVLIDFRL